MTECMIDLGREDPCKLVVRVIAGMPWTSPSMTRADASTWPAGLRLVFASGAQWAATLSGDSLTATISATEAEVGAVVNGEQVTLRDDATVYATGRARVTVVPL